MHAPFGTSSNPFPNGGNFAVAQFLSLVGRRHEVVFIAGCESAHQLALVWFAGDYGMVAGFQFTQHTVLFREVQPPFLFIGPMAIGAVLGKKRLNVPGKIYRCNAGQ